MPLKGSLKGYWKLRIGDYRVVFRIAASEVSILTILQRKVVYEEALARVAWRPGTMSTVTGRV